MKTAPQPEPLRLDGLLTADQRRTVTIEEHLAFRESIAAPSPADELEELLGDLRRVEPENSNEPRRL